VKKSPASSGKGPAASRVKPEEEKGRGTRMETKRAGDIMIPLDEYPHIPYWFTLRQATSELDKSEVEIGGRKSLPRVIVIGLFVWIIWPAMGMPILIH